MWWFFLVVGRQPGGGNFEVVLMGEGETGLYSGVLFVCGVSDGLIDIWSGGVWDVWWKLYLEVARDNGGALWWLVEVSDKVGEIPKCLVVGLS